jgi:hypothetical protein
MYPYPEKILFHVRHTAPPHPVYAVKSWGSYGVVCPSLTTSNGSISHIVAWLIGESAREGPRLEVVEPEWSGLSEADLEAKIRHVHREFCLGLKTNILLCGVSRSGKDTIGDLLRDHHGFFKESFAAPMKEMVRLAFPAFRADDLYGESDKRNTQYIEYPLSGDCVSCGRPCQEERPEGGWTCLWSCAACNRSYGTYLSPRLALQSLGTEWGRRLYKDVWVDACFSRIDAREGATPVVITDGRFLNEIRGSRRKGAFVVKLARGMSASTATHESEAELRSIPDAEFDYVFPDVPLRRLEAEVERMLEAAKRARVLLEWP